MSRGKQPNPLRKLPRQAQGIKALQTKLQAPKMQMVPSFDGLAGVGNFNYTSGLNIGYDTIFDCEDYGCNDEGICRCSKMENLHLESIHYPSLIQSIYNQSDSKTVEAIETVLKKSGFDQGNSWRFDVQGDYYGEELNGAYLEPSVEAKCDNLVRKLLSYANPLDQLEFAKSL